MYYHFYLKYVHLRLRLPHLVYAIKSDMSWEIIYRSGMLRGFNQRKINIWYNASCILPTVWDDLQTHAHTQCQFFII